MVFKPFPSLSRAGQMALQEPVDLSGVAISPAQAMAAAGNDTSALRLVERGGKPAYIVETAMGLVAVDAATSAVLAPMTQEATRNVAARLLGGTALVVAPIAYDQWVVHNRFDPLRPFFRIEARDAIGTELYLSARTGELVQRTLGTERAWNWAGAVLHWVYFTPLRSSFSAWDTTVWLLSFVAMLVAIAGTILGIIRTVAALRQARRSLSFFRGRWMRWHHISGLFVSPIILVWIFSGWLSMDHGRLFSRGQATPTQLAAFHGRPLSQSLAGINVSMLRTLPVAAEIAFDVIGGEPVIIVSDPTGSIRTFDGEARAISPVTLLASAKRGVAAAWPKAQIGSVSSVKPTDIFALAEGWPQATIALTLVGKDAPSIYVDSRDGRLLTVMTASRAEYAWLYYTLHTLNFPALSSRPLLRRILIVALLLFGFIFSMTGCVIGIERLRRSALGFPSR